jgi:hypothetical protein
MSTPKKQALLQIFLWFVLINAPVAASRAQSSLAGQPSGTSDDQSAASDSAAADGSTKSTRALVESCRADAKKQHLNGSLRRTHIIECVTAQNPRAAATMICRDSGRKKGLEGAQLKDFVRNCAKS